MVPSGTGPGIITPDGCAVELYARLPLGPEADIVHGAIAPGSSVLDLGAGTGRIAYGLVERGHDMVTVDESPAMLAHVRDALRVCATIETLALHREFGCVLLASHLVNTDDVGQRDAFLRTARRQVAPDGFVVLQRHPPTWFDDVEPFERTLGDLTVRLRDLSRLSRDRLSATMEYELGGRTWTQTFTARRLDDDALAAALASSDLALDSALTDDGAWVRATPR